jgi:hypothetical protein
MNKPLTLNEFIEQYDYEDSIVLLEGKRIVLADDKPKLIELGRLLAVNTSKMMFRSGNADGADHYFSMGVAEVDKTRLQLITPYMNHRQKWNQAFETISLDDINIADETDVLNQSKRNKSTQKLIDKFVAGDINRNTIKAAYIIRDTIKALGTKDIKPATFGIFYDDIRNPRKGGTGHTMDVCEQNNIPIIDQKEWKQWLIIND